MKTIRFSHLLSLALACAAGLAPIAASAGVASPPSPITEGFAIRIPTVKLATSPAGSAALEVSPAAVTFGGSTPVGGLSSQVQVQLKNAGTVSINSISPALTYLASDFELQNDCPSTLPPAGTCTVSVAFKPSAAGSLNGTLTVSSSASNGLQLVTLSGTGLAPDARLTAFDAPSTQVRAASTTTVKVENLSAVRLGLTASPLSGDFSVIGGDCGSSVAAGSQCTFSVGFNPSTVGAKTSPFAVTFSAGSSTFTRSAILKGVATSPSASITASVDFGQQPAASPLTQDITITNTGAGPLVLGTPSITGNGFAIAAGGTCGTSLAKDASCTVRVQLLPNGMDAHNGALSVQVQDGETLTASLTGQSLMAKLGAVAPSTRSFGNVLVGSSSTSDVHVVTNLGNAAATGLSLSVPSGFTLAGNTCGTSLGAGESCQFAIVFAPTAGQSFGGSITVSTANAGSQAVAVSGSGSQSVATLTSSPSVNLADWYSAGSVTGSFTFRNDGNAPMTLASPAVVSPLSVSTNTCSAVAPGSSCTISVALSLNASQGGSGSQSFTALGAAVAPAATTINWSVYSVAPNWASTTLDFGTLQIGQTLTKAIVLTNNGSVAVDWASNSGLNGLPAGFTADMSACSNVAPGGGCSVNITFTPTQAQLYSGSGIAPSYASIIGNTLTVTGVAQLGTATLSDLNFGSVPSGTGRALISALQNTGAASISVGAPTVSGPGFSIVTTTCGSSLAAGAQCAIRVLFTASGTDAATGTLTVPSGAGTKVANLTAQSVQAILSSISPSSRDFGAVTVGSSATSSAHTLSNTGNADATGLVFTPPAGFAVNAGTCGSTLAAGASCQFTLRFSPTQAMSYSGSMTISSDNAGSQSVAVTGSGVQSVATLTSAASITLADWYQSGTITGSFTYRNDGNQAMTLNSPGLVSPLTVAGNTCSSVAPGATCSITVALRRDDNTGGSGAQSFVATGATVAAAQATVNWSIYSTVSSWTPSTLNFGDVAVGASATMNTTLKNNGSVAAAWTTIPNLPSGYSANMSACGNVAPAGGTCNVAITFAPTAAQAYNSSGLSPSSVSIASNQLLLIGTGKAAPGSASLTNYFWGSYALGDDLDSYQLLTNTGSVGVSLTGTPYLSGGSPAFTYLGTDCPAVIQPGASCQIQIRFVAITRGTHLQNLYVPTTAGLITSFSNATVY